MKNFIFNIFVLLILSLFIAPAQAIDDKKDINTKIFTLDECIEFALENNKDLNISAEDIKIQKSRVGQAKSNYFPTLGVGTGYTFSSNKNSSNNTLTDNAFKVNTSVNQLIWDFGKTTAKINMNKYNLSSSKMDYDYQTLLVIYDVKTSYYAVLAAKAYSDISNRTVKINKLNYDRTKALFDVGLKSKIDVTNAEVNYTNSQIQLLEANEKYEASLIALADAMTYTDGINFDVAPTENFYFKPISNNIPDSYEESIKTLQNGDNSELILTSGIEKHDMLKDFNFKPYDITVEKAYEIALQNRPDLKSMDLVAKAAEESLKVLKRAYYPDLSASAGYDYNINQNNNSNAFRVTAGLNISGLNFMNIKTKIDEGLSLYNIALENYDITKNAIYFNVNNTYITMKQLEKRIPLMAQKVNQTLENFELADGRYTVGLGNFIELQDAQNNYNQAQLEFVQTVFKYNVAKEEFLKSMGVR